MGTWVNEGSQPIVCAPDLAASAGLQARAFTTLGCSLALLQPRRRLTRRQARPEPFERTQFVETDQCDAGHDQRAKQTVAAHLWHFLSQVEQSEAR